MSSARNDEGEARYLMREIVHKKYTFLVNLGDTDIGALRDLMPPQTDRWDKPRLDTALKHFVEEYARIRRIEA